MLQLNLLVLKTDRLADLHHFYSQLGFTFDKHRHGTGPEHYASSNSNVVLELYPAKQADKNTRLGFTVRGLNHIITGLKVISAPARTEWGYTAVVEDPDGRKVELTEADDIPLPHNATN